MASQLLKCVGPAILVSVRKLYRKIAMDPFIAIPAILLAGAAVIFVARQARSGPGEDVVQAARARAEQRALDRQWADTDPVDDPWEGRLDLSAVSAAEVDDRFDGRGPLDLEQKRVVNVILEGVDVSYVDTVDPAGHVFSQDNRTESVDPWARSDK